VVFEDEIIVVVGGPTGRVVLHRNDRGHDERGIFHKAARLLSILSAHRVTSGSVPATGGASSGGEWVSERRLGSVSKDGSLLTAAPQGGFVSSVSDNDGSVLATNAVPGARTGRS